MSTAGPSRQDEGRDVAVWCWQDRLGRLGRAIYGPVRARAGLTLPGHFLSPQASPPACERCLS